MTTDVIELENVKIERDEGTTFIILNRPEKRNAMSPQLHMDMCNALDWAEEDEQTKVVVITGAGRNFCAGQDLKLYFRGTDDDPHMRARSRRAAHRWRWEKLSSFPKATIAMVHGYCFGGGFTPVIACDFAIAADDATFGLSEVNWGIIPGGLVAWAVTQVMNYRDAIYYSVTGDRFSGAEAAAMKFVNKSVPLAKLREQTMELARKLEAKSPAAVRYTKEAVRSVRGMSHAQALDYLNCKSDALKFKDPENGREKAMKQFLDEKVFKPGLGEFKR
ncbi:MAG: p-hydroxycinnamoyl CoA hydratase/lyase [Hyphomicrobiales bacterium]|nr:p-hydroxycinnamoyl CoA hydratase/lyase [Hyphomicrobiales bacterium]